MWVCPTSLWDGRTILICDHICTVYRDVLNLYELDTSKVGSTGGQEQEQADDWFTSRFENGVARFTAIQCGIDSEHELIARHLKAVAVTGHCVLFDICCGSATASLSMIGNLIKLREVGALKLTPLTIEVHGWDFSERALDIGGELLKRLTSPALAVAINIV